MLTNILQISVSLAFLGVFAEAITVKCNYAASYPGQTGLLYVGGSDASAAVANKNIGFDAQGVATLNTEQPVTFTSFACTNDVQNIQTPSQVVFGSRKVTQIFYKIAVGDLKSRKSLNVKDTCLTVNLGSASGVLNRDYDFLALYKTNCKFESIPGWQRAQTFVGIKNDTSTNPLFLKFLGWEDGDQYKTSTGGNNIFTADYSEDKIIYINQQGSEAPALEGLKFGKAPK